MKDGVAVQLQVSLLDQVALISLSTCIINVVCLGFAFHVLNFSHQSRLVSGYHQPQVTAPGLKKTKAIERPRCPHPPWQNRYEAWWKDGLMKVQLGFLDLIDSTCQYSVVPRDLVTENK